MSIEGQGHFFTIYFPGFVCFVLYQAKISGERLQDHWSSGFKYILIFAQNIDCGYTLEPPRCETSTHNLCFGAKIRKNVYSCKPLIFYIKVGCKAVFVTRLCFRDGS